ncbi:MAG: hypothetical protein ABL951_05230 [Alphaproteobacteria bacterium]
MNNTVIRKNLLAATVSTSVMLQLAPGAVMTLPMYTITDLGEDSEIQAFSINDYC